MSKFARLGAIASLMAVATAISTPAAAASLAGSTITNTVSVAYKVDGVTQTPKTASDSFVVDRKVNLTVVQDGSSRTQVAPGRAEQSTTFLVSNLTNAPIDIGLAATDLGTGGFALSNIKIYRDNTSAGSVGSYDAADTLVTHLDQIPAETSNIRVFVVADIPLSATNAQVADVRLTGTALDAVTPGAAGTALTASASNTSGMDTVLADSNADGVNTARDGIHFADDGYVIATASLGVVKRSRVVGTTINGVTNTFAIPGATIEYCIVATNTTATAANDVTITDDLPEETTFVPGSVRVNGTLTGLGECDNTTGTAVADATAFLARTSPLKDQVSGTIPSVASGTPRTVLFQVTIN